MARDLPAIDRLIEEGLALYGQGDLDGALQVWDEALELDPENPQAASYVEYVRMNYELLTSEVVEGASAPFGINDDEPEYLIEIVPGEIEPAQQPYRANQLDEGWYIDDESGRSHVAHLRVPNGDNDAGYTVELEADEPPLPEHLAAATEPPAEPAEPEEPDEGEEPDDGDDETHRAPVVAQPPERPSESFETATSEYQGAGKYHDSEQPTGEFRPESTPTPGFEHVADSLTPGFETQSSGFGTQVTHLRKRDLGFVQATPPPEEDDGPRGPNASAPPELKMTLRTPNVDAFDREGGDEDPDGGPEDSFDDFAQAPPDDQEPPPANAVIELSYDSDPDDDDDIELERFPLDPRSNSREMAKLGVGLPSLPPKKAPSRERILPLPADPEPDEDSDEPIIEKSYEADDLISSLPSPTPAPTVPRIERRTGDRLPPLPIPASEQPRQTRPSDPARNAKQTERIATTRDLPGTTRPPAKPTSEQMPSIQMPSTGSAPTQDFEATTQDKTNRAITKPSLDERALLGREPTEERRFPPLEQIPDPRAVTREVPTNKLPPVPRSERPTDRPPHARGLAEPSDGGSASPLVSAPTRDLGIRELATRHEGRAPEKTPRQRPPSAEREGTSYDSVLPFDPIDARSASILEHIDDDAPANESKDDRTRRRITTLFDRANEWCRDNELDRAVAAVDLALSEDPSSALAQKLIHRNRETMQNVFQLFLGDLERQPQLARPLHELGTAPISPRAAFLLSRVDGTLSLDEILDVSGMPRLEAYRYLCQLFLRGILR